MGATTIEDAARRAGHHRWTEMRLFELMGGWVSAVADPEAKIRLHVAARHHGWHAGLWGNVLPDASEDAVRRLAVAPSEAVRSLFESLRGPEGGGDTPEKLVAVYRVLLPHLVATYRAELGAASEVSDGPTIRTLRLVLRDEEDDWRRGERLVRSLLRNGEEIQRAAAHQGRLEAVLARAGGAP